MDRIHNSRNLQEKLRESDSYILPSVTVLTTVCLAFSLMSIFNGTSDAFLPLFAIPAIMLAFSYPWESVLFSTGVCISYTIFRFFHGQFWMQPPSFFIQGVLAPVAFFEMLAILTALGAWPRTRQLHLLKKEIARLGDSLATTTETLNEMTEHHKRTEEALDESGKRLQALLDQVTFPVVKLNQELYITAVNSLFLQFTGKTEFDLVGRNISALPEFFAHLVETKEASFILPSKGSAIKQQLVWRISDIKPDLDHNKNYILITGVDLPSE